MKNQEEVFCGYLRTSAYFAVEILSVCDEILCGGDSFLFAVKILCGGDSFLIGRGTTLIETQSIGMER
jgi:hypothetical protein